MPLTASEHYDVAEDCLADAENAEDPVEQKYFLDKAAVHAQMADIGLHAMYIRSKVGHQWLTYGEFGIGNG